MSIFESLHIYGMEKIEDAVLAGLATGDPVLFIGGHGSAKTLLTQRIAGAMGLDFHSYDASKAMFEDVIGFPNPDSLCRGVIEYTPTPISIWGKEFVLVDELSRASQAMQNKWLEVIRSRQIMGKRVESLQFIFAAMNPPGYLGSMPLDEALAGRFAFVIRVPEAKDMSSDNLGRIITHLSEYDAPALGGSQESPRHSDLSELVRKTRAAFPEVAKARGDMLRAYVTQLAVAFKLNHHPLDGRRLGMIWRNLVAYLSVRSVKNGIEDFSREQLDELCAECLRFSLPFEAVGGNLGDQIVFLSHRTAARLLWEKTGEIEQRLKIFLAGGPLKMARAYLEIGREVPAGEHQEFVSFLEEILSANGDPSGMAQAFLALEAVIRAYQNGTVRADADTMRRAIKIYLKLTDLKAHDVIFDLVRYQRVYGTPSRIDLGDRCDNLAFRLTLNLLNCTDKSRGPMRRSRRYHDPVMKDIGNYFDGVRFELRRHGHEDHRT